MLPAQPCPLLENIAERLVDAGTFLLLAAEQRDAFAVLTQARQNITEFRLGLVLGFGHRHEIFADNDHRAAGNGGIDNSGNDQKARDGDCAAAKRHRQRAADGPQHHDEGRGREKRLRDAGREIDRRICGNPQIFRDPVLRILVIAFDQIELIVTPVVQPARDDGIREPRAPAPLDAHPREHLRDTEDDAADRQREEYPGQIKDLRGVLLFNRIEDRPVPDIDAVLKRDLQDDQRDQADAEDPCETADACAPVASRADPEAREQVIAPQLFDFFW